MIFRTEINDLNFPFELSYNDTISLIGSCFSDNIGNKLKNLGFKVLSNPFGVVYNPYSVYKQIERIIELKIPQVNEYKQKGEFWHHFDFHGSTRNPDKSQLHSSLVEIIEKSHLFLRYANFIFITLGTNIVYETKETHEIVANNHKYPADYFIQKKLFYDKVLKMSEEILLKLFAFNQDIKVVFTVSPVRHIRDGLIENQRSKSVLIASISTLCDNKKVFYFPSYEIMMDDLRDYRFYESDLIHPSAQATEYIFEKFRNSFLSDKTKSIADEILKINLAINHRPLFPESNEHKLFIENLKEKIRTMQLKYPEIRFPFENHLD
jgi:hypothetical protein